MVLGITQVKLKSTYTLIIICRGIYEGEVDQQN